jgi:HNH endonuclease
MSQGTAHPTGDLSILYPQVPAQIDIPAVTDAKQAILNAPRGNLTPETHTKIQNSILGVLELSPNPITAAEWIIKKLTPHSDVEEELLPSLYANISSACQFVKSSGAGRRPKGSPSTSGAATPVSSTLAEGWKEDPTAIATSLRTVGRSSNSSTLIKTVRLCRITGDTTSPIDSCHIIAFSTSNPANPRLASYIDLVKAMFGEAAWLALLTNVVDGSSDQGGRNINRLDNEIPMTPSCHRAWDTMAFVLEVDWSTYNSGTGEVWWYPILACREYHTNLLVCMSSLMLHSSGLQPPKMPSTTAGMAPYLLCPLVVLFSLPWKRALLYPFDVLYPLHFQMDDNLTLRRYQVHICYMSERRW